MVASRFRALWDIPLSASLCAFHPLLSSPLSTTISVFSLSLSLSFPVNRSFPGGTAGIWIPPSLYTELSLPRFLLFFFSASLFFSRASTRSLCHDRRLVSESTASIRSTIVNWNAIVQKPNVYIYIYRFRGNIFRQEYLVSWKTFVSVLLREERIGREGRKIVLRINQIEIIRANSANLPQLSLSKIKSKHTQRFEIFRGGRDGIPPGTLLFSREHDAGNFITTRYLSIKLEEGGREERGRGGRGGIVSFARTGVKKIIEREREKKKEKKDRRNGHIICWHALSPLEFMDPTTTAWFNGRIVSTDRYLGTNGLIKYD